MIDRNAPFASYTDKYVSFRYPEYLRVEPYSLALDYVVTPKKKRLRGQESVSLRVLLPNETNEMFVQSFRFQLSNPTELEWGGVRQWTMRSGPTMLRPDASERVLIHENVATHDAGYTWEILFPIQPADIHLAINGEGEFAADEPVWREVIESIELHSADFVPAESPKQSTRRIKGKRVTARQRKLKTALASLPDELKYLAPVAIDLSDQDPEEFACGEGDLTAFDESIATMTADLSRSEALAAVARHRKLLHEWLEKHADHGASYLLPLHGIEGALVGYLMHSGPTPDDDILRLAGLIENIL